MDGVLLFGRLPIAMVLLAAGLRSLIDRSGSRAAMLAFGVSACLAGPTATLLGVSEVSAALILLPFAGWWTPLAIAGVVAGLVMCAAFAVVGYRTRERSAAQRRIPTRAATRLAA
jgi:hypothetical protein